MATEDLLSRIERLEQGRAEEVPQGDPDRAAREAVRLPRTPNVPTVDGVPLHEFLGEPDRPFPQGRGLDNPDRRPVKNSLLDRIDSTLDQRQGRQLTDFGGKLALNPLVVSTPVNETGNRRVDKAGERRSDRAPLFARSSQIPQKVYPALEDLPADSNERVIAQRALEGIDFTRGADFNVRLKRAAGSSIPRAKAMVLADMIQNVPSGVEPLLWDGALDRFYLADVIDPDDVKAGREQEADLGKVRYIAVDEEQLTMGDVADLIQPAEIGAIIGSIVGTKKFGKIIGFDPGLKKLAGRVSGEAGIATLGRSGGEVLGLVMDYINTDGEFIPTREELRELGLQSVTTEFIATLLGEVGARALGKSSDLVQEAVIRKLGGSGVIGSAADIASSNKNIARARRDMRRISTVTGKEGFAITQGEATGSIVLREGEQSFRRSASPATKRELEVQQARNNEITGEFIDNLFGGNVRVFENRFGIVSQANRHFAHDDIIVAEVVGRTSKARPRIAFAPEGQTDMGLVVDAHDDFWKVSTVVLPERLRQTGISDDLYVAASREASAHGKHLVSDSIMTPAARKVWQRLSATTDEFKGAKLTDVEIKSIPTDAGEVWQTVDGSPLYRTVAPEPVYPKLMAKFRRPSQGAGGKLEANKEFRQFLRSPTRKDVGQVLDEIGTNRLMMQDFREAVLQDYEKRVLKNNKFNLTEFEKWKSETAGVVNKVFNAEEVADIQLRGGLRKVVEEGRERVASLDKSLQAFFRPKAVTQLRSPNKPQTVYKDWQKMGPIKRKRAMVVLEQAGMGDDMRALLFEDIRQQIKPRLIGKTTSAPAAENFKTWLKNNEQMVKDLFPSTATNPKRGQQYVQDLRIVASLMDRKAFSSSVTGTIPEANPSILALTRVAFGPLSRAQRFFTAGRRLQTRKLGEKAVEIATTPEQLRFLVQIQQFPIASRIGAQTLTRLGLNEIYPDALDFENPREMKLFIDDIMQIGAILGEVQE